MTVSSHMLSIAENQWALAGTVTAKRAKIEGGKRYIYLPAEGNIHGLRHAGDFIRRITEKLAL